MLNPSGRRHAALAALAVLAVAAVTGCKTPQPIYEQEQFGSTSPYSHSYAAGISATCEAARRALLSQGYVINQARSDLIDARKSFQQDSDTHEEIEFHVVCALAGGKDDTSMAFVNAVQERYSLKKTNSSASVGVGAIGAVSLPFGSSDDALVKVASETIHANAFYERFFELVEHYLVPGLSVPITPVEPRRPLPVTGPHTD
jgi:hypothetical protein